MKKLWLVSALSLGLLLLAGCNTVTTQGGGVSIDSSDDMISMYNASKAITCNLSYDSEEEQWTSVMYIKDWMISQVTNSTMDWEDVTLYTLARDGKMYVWGNVYGEGVWMSASYEMDIEEELKWFDEVEEDTKVSCAKWVKDDSVFNLPTDVDFTSMDEWLSYDVDEDYSMPQQVEEGDEVVAEGVEENNEVVAEAVEEVVEEVTE